MSAEELSDFIREKITKEKISVVDLSKKSGLARTSIYKILGAEVKEARLSTFIKLGGALSIHPLEMMKIFFNRWEFPRNTSERSKPRVKGDDTSFIADITYPDNSIVSAKQKFEKIWRIKNVGKIDWQGRKIICLDQSTRVQYDDKILTYGLTPESIEVDLPLVKAEDYVDISINFTAPDMPCSVLSHWKMCDSDNNLCFPKLNGIYCMVKVI